MAAQVLLPNKNYRLYASAGAEALLAWYNPVKALFETTGWWNAANAVHTLIDYSLLTGSTQYRSVIEHFFNQHADGSFLNNYYDDEGWWALTWTNAFDLTGEVRYLQMAQTIFEDIKQGWDSRCRGGVWWSKERTYKNAIANELFLALGARLYERTAGSPVRQQYGDWALATWNWFAKSGLITPDYLVSDGLTKRCTSNRGVNWTYNQGVLLGGLVDLYKMTEQESYLQMAEALANATLHYLVNENGILTEPCERTDCGADGPQFKGVFLRNLLKLYLVDRRSIYRQFIVKNVEAIITYNKTTSHQYGLYWGGPVDRIDAARQSSALDALVAAIPFSADGPLLTNLALSVPTQADASCSPLEGPEKAVDGTVLYNSKWCSPGTSGRYWLQLDLTRPVMIGRIVLNHAGAGGEDPMYNTCDFGIQVSLDGTSWQTIVSVTGNTASVTTHQFEPQEVRYLTLLITNPQRSPEHKAARIYQFEIYEI
ncbi:glycoside hydrolase family 76 protein [Tengunoibacter tsumagoiensis]|uniref:F5/8 type C domain-containing protein n=1 Tax=Tengunoibacter tsumagoiensis TaxID=2014871 RepID=A0A401ZYU5_9CHLR|nr:glycoside hydrolase family 76 protein [Tengunoibacter tsumagoiensis]GCE12026.1 hypothetical protein KTT_18850 [Tengunoibacter tsumagoiensis]